MQANQAMVQFNDQSDALTGLLCLNCSSTNLTTNESNDGDSQVVCEACGHSISIIQGIYHFIKHRGQDPPVVGVDYSCDDWRDRELDREREFERNRGVTDAWLLSLPFPNEETETTFQKKNGALGRNFFEVVDRLGLKPGARVFDMAAGTCWTSREFANRGCNVVATDVGTIKYAGLRSAEAYFQAGSKRFERFCWEFGKIPFEDNTFDVVFCQNAFQYVEDLRSMLREVLRVLKPNGQLALLWTGARAPFKNSKWGPGHYLSAYVYHARRAGFREINCEIPRPLLNESGLLETRERSKTDRVLGKLFATTWRCVKPWHRWLIGKPMLPIAFLFGMPFNLIATKPAAESEPK